MTPMGLCAAVLCVGDAGRRGLVTAKRVTCSPQGEDNVPYRFVRCRLCVGDYGRSRTPVPTDLCVAGLCVSPPNGAAFRIHCRGRPPDAPFVRFPAERCGYVGLPQGGEVALASRARRHNARRWSRGTATAVDEDVGTHMPGKRPAVRLFVGVRHPLCIADGGGSKPPPYGFVCCFQESKKVSLYCVILSERTNASRRISAAQSKRGRGVYTPNSSANIAFRMRGLLPPLRGPPPSRREAYGRIPASKAATHFVSLAFSCKGFLSSPCGEHADVPLRGNRGGGADPLFAKRGPPPYLTL